MHETIIINRLLEEASSHGKVKSIKVEVGELAEIHPLDLREHLVQRLPGSTVIEKESRIQCGCGYDGRAEIVEKAHDFTIYECPECKNNDPTVIEGRDIVLKEVEVE